MRETQELVTIVPWTFIATICNLFIQCWLIKKFLFKPIREVIEKRRALADSQIQDAKKAKEEAESASSPFVFCQIIIFCSDYSADPLSSEPAFPSI